MSGIKTAVDVQQNEFVTKAYLDFVKRYELAYSDFASNVYRIPVDAGKRVLGVRLHTKEAFTGGTPTAKVGDGADDDGFILTTDIDTTTLNTVCDSRMLGHDVTGTWTLNAYAKGGKHFAAAGFVLVTIAASATAGKLVVEVIYDGYEATPKDRIGNA